MKETIDHLMSFQESFMEILYATDDIEIIQNKLEIYHDDPFVGTWIKALTPQMLEVAARMTQHWGKKAEQA